jgi:hypothetical protein
MSPSSVDSVTILVSTFTLQFHVKAGISSKYGYFMYIFLKVFTQCLTLYNVPFYEPMYHESLFVLIYFCSNSFFQQVFAGVFGPPSKVEVELLSCAHDPSLWTYR